MGNAVEECEELQKRVQILQDELEKLQNEVNAQTSTTVSSPDSITSQDAIQSESLTPWANSSIITKARLLSDNTNHSKAVKVSSLLLNTQMKC